MKEMEKMYPGKITYINIRNQEEKDNSNIKVYEEKISEKLYLIEYEFKDVHPQGSDSKINKDAWMGNYTI